jgi:hypothetical protein
MPKNRFTEEELAFPAKQTEAGASVGRICRKVSLFTNATTALSRCVRYSRAKSDLANAYA